MKLMGIMTFFWALSGFAQSSNTITKLECTSRDGWYGHLEEVDYPRIAANYTIFMANKKSDEIFQGTAFADFTKLSSKYSVEMDIRTVYRPTTFDIESLTVTKYFPTLLPPKLLDPLYTHRLIVKRFNKPAFVLNCE